MGFDPISVALIGGLVISGAGAGISYKASQDQSQASRRAEQARKQQAALDAERRRREIIRNAQLAQATRATNLTSAGVSLDSSASAGAYGQIAGAQGSQINDLSQNLSLGYQVFDANMAYARAGAFGALGSGLSQFGSQLMSSSAPLARVGSDLFGGSGRIASNSSQYASNGTFNLNKL
jgi:hypothetical protein